MNSYYLRTALVFGLILLFSLTIHYFALSPNGDALEVTPFLYYPFAVITQAMCLGLITALFLFIDHWVKKRKWINQLVFTLVVMIYVLLEVVNLQISRWIGPLTLGYLKTYLGSGSSKYTSPESLHYLARLFGKDLPVIISSFLSLFATIIVAVVMFLRRKTSTDIPFGLPIKIGISGIVLCFAASFFYPAFIWNRIEPIPLVFTKEIFLSFFDSSYPRNPKQAFADLISYSKGGQLSDSEIEQWPEYPLLKSGPGNLDKNSFAAAEKDKKPNIIFLEMESFRGWESGLVNDPNYVSKTPEMDTFFKENAAYFPWVDSNGFLSAVGTLCLNLGIPPHYVGFPATDYPNLNASSVAEILRDFGYNAEIRVGADPGISNFTRWFDRWYETTNLDIDATDDHLMYEKMKSDMQRLKEKGKPYYLAFYSITPHIPFTVPASEGVEPAKLMEERFGQVIRYATKYMVKFLEYLKSTEDWENTIVVICGDHSYPTPDQVRLQRFVGGLNPGQTWISLAFTGGWKGLPKPGLYDRVATQIDVPVTLLKMLDIKAENSFMGQDLFSDGPRPGLIIRDRYIVLQYPDKRYFFNLFDKNVYRQKIDRYNIQEYGMLGSGYRFEAEKIDDIQAERWRDLVRALSWLYEKNKVFPYSPQYLK